MAHELLGESFDIHGGGLDLQFPHHENEIAQSACAHPHGDFAHYWLHNEMLQVEGKKMSKSLGNFFTVRDLLDQGIPGEVIRFVFLMTHYRSPMDWTAEKARVASQTLKQWFRLSEPEKPDSYGAFAVVPHLADDLNTNAVLGQLYALADSGDGAQLKAALELIGLRPSSDWWQQKEQSLEIEQFSISASWSGNRPPEDAELALNLARKWAELRRSKSYGLADALRAAAMSAGLELRASKGREAHAELKDDFDLTKLEALK
jgi:cysteinyl-tRNA synthetase